MASSDNENYATKFVNVLDTIQDKPAAATEEEEEEEEEEEAAAAATKGEGGQEQEGGERGEENKDEKWRYIPLLHAALRGDWDSAKRIFDQDEAAFSANITDYKETALHVSVSSARSIDFVKKLVDLMPAEALELPNTYGMTALHNAAGIGNTKAAAILVDKHPASLYISDNLNWLPLHWAADCGHKETLLYLLSVTKEDHPVSMPFACSSGAQLLSRVVASEFYDIALNLVRRYPELAMSKLDDGKYALQAMAYSASAFSSGSRLNRWQHFIYSFSQNLQAMLWKVLELLVPHIKHVQKQKLMHLQAIQLVKCLCEKIRSLSDSNAYELLCKDVILTAARLGIHEVVEEIIESFPRAVWSMDADNHNIFQLAVMYRCENIFNLIYQMSGYKQTVMMLMDDSMNSILHLVGRLAPHDKLNLVPGAALQMQRELQWFKEVEKFVRPCYKEMPNASGEIPSMIFTREHKNLVIEGEKWMKDTATSCTITAALIATIAFAAVITVPGGDNGTSGIPIFSNNKAFTIFATSDAISLFTSTASLLMFLSILTSRYAEGDFLYVLPMRLTIGLVTLFLSITTMILAFNSILYLLFCKNKEWILIPMATLACLPITSFVSLQFPLLVDLISSTFGPGIFGKQSDRPFY